MDMRWRLSMDTQRGLNAATATRKSTFQLKSCVIDLKEESRYKMNSKGIIMNVNADGVRRLVLEFLRTNQNIHNFFYAVSQTRPSKFKTVHEWKCLGKDVNEKPCLTKGKVTITCTNLDFVVEDTVCDHSGGFGNRLSGFERAQVAQELENKTPAKAIISEHLNLGLGPIPAYSIYSTQQEINTRLYRKHLCPITSCVQWRMEMDQSGGYIQEISTRHGHFHMDLYSDVSKSMWRDLHESHVFFIDATGGMVNTAGIKRYMGLDSIKSVLHTCIYVTPKQTIGEINALGTLMYDCGHLYMTKVM